MKRKSCLVNSSIQGKILPAMEMSHFVSNKRKPTIACSCIISNNSDRAYQNQLGRPGDFRRRYNFLTPIACAATSPFATVLSTMMFSCQRARLDMDRRETKISMAVLVNCQRRPTMKLQQFVYILPRRTVPFVAESVLIPLKRRFRRSTRSYSSWMKAFSCVPMLIGFISSNTMSLV